MTRPPELRVLPDAGTLAETARGEILRVAAQAKSARGAFHISLAGASTPQPTYAALARDPTELEGWQIWFGDERCVPPDHPDSNYRMARASLLDPAGLPPQAVHRMQGELDDPAQAASRYERELRESFGVATGAPRLDLVLLGLGDDAHTASLFPGSPALDERERLVAAPWVEHLDAFRLTFTLPLIRAARQVLFLVAGAEKAPALRAVLEPRPGEPPPPAAQVRPTDGALVFLVDRAAAGGLSTARLE